MKKRTLLFILSVLPLFLFSKTLTKNELKALGVRAFQQKAQYICPQATHYALKQCEFIEHGGVLEMAVLHFDAGFLIMSAEDAVMPILAYDFEHHIDLSNLAPGAEMFLSIYRQEIEAARRTQSAQSEKIKAEWEALRYPSLRGTRTETVVAPLIHSTWNQDKYYNQLCPLDENAPSGYDGHVPNGCVAVAMSQIMYYYRYPETGNGSHTNYTEYGSFHVNFSQQHYHYDAMCDKLNHFNNEVAKLIFHCGTAVDMMYGADGSGAYSGNVPGALNTFFKYSPDATYLHKHDYSYYTWHSMLMNNLDDSHPVFYSGYSEEGGHAFICDGYNSDEYFHFNFGWGGEDNGFYLTESNNPDDVIVGGYDYGQSAIFNIYPLENSYPSYCQSRTITAANGSLEDGSGIYPYQDNSSCTYIITYSDQYAAEIQLKDMDTQEGHDFLRFWNGHPSQDSLLMEVSGSTTGSFFFQTDSLYITFETDDSIAGQGWRLEYSSLRDGPGCSSHNYNTPTGEIYDGSGDGNYRDNASCAWNLRLNNYDHIIFTFEEMDLAPGDHIDFYSLTNFSDLLASYTGNTPPSPLVCNSNKIRVVFVSDNYLNASGFLIRWNASNTGIEDWDDQTILYPNPASDLIHLNLPDDFGSCNITIYDMVGKSVYSQRHIDSQTIDIPVHNFLNGVYTLRVEGNNRSIHKKIIVQH